MLDNSSALWYIIVTGQVIEPTFYSCLIKGGLQMKSRKETTVGAYLDGKKLVDVIKAVLDNHMTVRAMKDLLIEENPHGKVAFKVE